MNHKLHADEIDTGDDIARALIGTQFPQWAHLSLSSIASTGTDNAIYRLGDELGIRLPRIERAVDAVTKEHAWLPCLAGHLPVPVPEPVTLGQPGGGYPYPWLVFRWLDGADVLAAPVADWSQLAREVADFVAALERIDTVRAPPAGYRAGPLAPHANDTRAAIIGLGGVLDADRALTIWDEAVAAEPWTGAPVWVHGDLLPGNILLQDGHLSGIIDWGATGVGDPACDAMLAWSLPPDARAIFRSALAIDEATWARGRGWTVQQAVHFIPYYAETIPRGVTAARHRLEAVLADQ